MSKIKEKYSDAIHDAGVIESYYKFRKQVREDKTNGYIKEATIKDMFIKQLGERYYDESTEGRG